MKKFFIIFSIIVVACVCCLAGCVKSNGSQVLDLNSCEIGYEFEVCPNTEFDYKINDNFIIHIQNIKATLIEKNKIGDNDVLQGRYSPCVVRIQVIGYTNSIHKGARVDIIVCSLSVGMNIPVTISNDGTFTGEIETNAIRVAYPIYFSEVI